MRAEIARASREMLADYKLRRGQPLLPADHEQRVRQIIRGMMLESMTVFGGRILFRKSWSPVQEAKAAEEFWLRLIEEYIAAEAIRRRISAISRTTRAEVIRLITRGEETGASIDDIVKSILTAIGSLSRDRAITIARTETHGAANFAADRTAKESGLELMKEWVSAEDPRTRDFGEGDGEPDAFNHRMMNGVVVAMNAPFQVPKPLGLTEPLMFPGDPQGSPGNIINCRCAVVHVVAD